MKHWLVIYDIADSKRLARTAKIIANYGVRVQKSVFEVDASNRTISEMRSRIQQVIDMDEDYIVYFSICERDWQKQMKIGIGKNIRCDDTPYQVL
jgi:CRISPR-associated protein Cas2